MPSSPKTLREAIDEANHILARHDGIHQLHSDVGALLLMLKCSQKGEPIDHGDVDRILQRMRRADYTGVWTAE